VTNDEQRRCLRVADGLETALAFRSRPLLDTAVRESIKELRAVANAPSDAIATAVDAELRPLADALIEAGHKLAQQAASDSCDDLCMLPAPEREP
jgi:hypothetical protein